MAKLAAQLKSKFFGLVGRFTVCGRAGHKDAVGDEGLNLVSSFCSCW
uniref:Uncharacterized protein n=1 Tax=Aegilops tauschii subsp. strangulata TaxID=200361 RepID=A0A453M094_AEGTS